MTTCLSLVVVVVGEGPTIRLLELAQVLGQPSPHGTSKTLVLQKSIPWTSLCQLRTRTDFFAFLRVHVGYLSFAFVRFVRCLDILRIFVRLERLYVVTCVIFLLDYNCI
jgi:hypothetical protein